MTSPEPPTPAVFVLLVALSRVPRHGYGLGQEVQRMTDGRVRLGAGTLYRSLQRMRVAGWVEESGSDTDDERRRVYSLTPAGRSAARAETRRLADLVALATEAGLLEDAPTPREDEHTP
ncbi:PadR family transcriptional regulator [Actinophytocola xanthii]|uniref:PadR family transcriptional regulator n=1 Tax=Actinophytocola xanthii TaxID=1912961 RepID=A0A1Q8CSB0_9PSEU|nr:helix-turn-helix transcriptional regulator [Actinophytocola xanthii]OLF17223.1 PadR family transcriptional regulator [Actinophytocola xanthii]